MRTESLKCAATAFILILLTSCVSFSRNYLPSISKISPLPETSSKNTVGYLFLLENDAPVREEQEAQEKYEREFIDVLRRSGYFSSISKGNEGKINIQVRIVTQTGSVAVDLVKTLISMMSFMVIPLYITQDYNVTANVTTPNGKEYVYEFRDSVTGVAWLFLYPFTSVDTDHARVEQQVRYNIWGNLILKMQQDGILS